MTFYALISYFKLVIVMCYRVIFSHLGMGIKAIKLQFKVNVKLIMLLHYLLTKTSKYNIIINPINCIP